MTRVGFQEGFTILSALKEREWVFCESPHVYCPDCGARYRETTKVRKHRPNCPYAAALKNIRSVPLAPFGYSPR